MKSENFEITIDQADDGYILSVTQRCYVRGCKNVHQKNFVATTLDEVVLKAKDFIRGASFVPNAAPPPPPDPV